MKYERKIEIIPPENIEKIKHLANIEKIKHISGIGTAIIEHQGIRASKMAFEGLKLRYPNTTAFVLGKHVNFSIICSFLSSYFTIYHNAPSPGEIDAILACAEKRHTILRCPITAGVQ